MTYKNPTQNQSLFKFHGAEVRAFTINNEPWFLAKDIFLALEITWRGSDSLQNIPTNWKMTTEIPDSYGRLQDPFLISEPAVYKLAFRSNKPAAEAFTHWVAEVVLPTLRKTGTFSLDAEVEGQAYAEFMRSRKKLRLRRELAALETQAPTDYCTMDEFLSIVPVDDANRLSLHARARKSCAPIRAWNPAQRRIATMYSLELLEKFLASPSASLPIN